MKKLAYLLLCSMLLLAYSCSDDDDDPVTYAISVKLIYPAETGYSAVEGQSVKLENKNTKTFYDAKTDGQGVAKFNVTAGVYEATASDMRNDGIKITHFNVTKSNISVTANINEPIDLLFTASIENTLVIKELYFGGCPKDDGSGTFARDQYVILYNNSSSIVDLSKIVLGMVLPYNSSEKNSDYVNGKLSYEAEGWIPAGTGVWYFQQEVKLEPGKQIVIAINNALDNTKTYSQSINFANPEYYCNYDIATYPQKLYYPAPAKEIPTSHYLKAYHYGTSKAWVISQVSPAFFIFRPEGTTIADFVADATNISLYGGSATQVRKKVKTEWVVDAVEVFNKGAIGHQKRLTPSVDAGYVEITNKLGYTLYRNVNKEATEALDSNKGKLVYNYSLGVESTDPSGIDAEESIKNGARIIYKDTNNSTNDFHQRRRASLRN